MQAQTASNSSGGAGAVPPPSRLVRVAVGGIGYGGRDDSLVTLLGSCVGVVIWDPGKKLAGLAHVVLPHIESRVDCEPGRFADTAVYEMIQHLKGQGSEVDKLRAKIVGGANLFGSPIAFDVGRKNAEAVRDQLAKYHVPIVAEGVGGDKGCMIRFSPATGRLEVSVARRLVANL